MIVGFPLEMSPRDLLRLIRDEAKRKGLPPVIIEHGSRHDKFICFGIVAIVPRHGEIAKGTLHSILKSYEPIFGERWWIK